MADEPTPASPSSETPPPRTTGGNFRWEPPTAEELQKLMPGYTIEKILGRGGMGAVYRGVQTNLDRPVAIKILPPGVEKEDPSFAERFKSEARLMARLTNPAVVGVYDFGTNLGGQLYFAMEYVDGSDVSQMIAAQGKLPPEHALAITAHVCDALAAAHELGIVHRDIKPANVLLNMKGQVKVADFGLAKVEDPGQHGLTKTGYAMGTPDFVAPEALMLGTAIDGRADLYAVGVMLYQMLTGNIPRGAFKPASALVPGLDPRFDPIIMKAMQHDREERHQNAAELRRELDVILTVPFVRNDAPVSAAIPVAQVAQAPGQRSAAQRPQQRSAGAPTRQPGVKAGEGPRAPETPPKSKMPLFLGLGVAAAIGIGAFVTLRSGSRETSAERPQANASSSKPSGTLTSSATSKVSTPPKPASSGSRETSAERPPAKATVTSTATKSSSPPPKPAIPSPAATKPAEPQFPLGKWVKIYTLFEHLPKELQNPALGLKVEKGWIRLGKQKRSVELPSILKTNYAVRARFLRHGEDTQLSRIIMRDAGRSGDYYQALVQNSLIIHQHEGENWKTLRAASAPPIAADQQYLLEFGVVGERLVARSGTAFATITNSTYAEGPARIFGTEDMRDIEVINLDGLSEAEALKILGVDEKGNDLRQPASIVATAPAPSVSKSPPLPSSASSDKFPPGQWVKMFNKAEELPENLRNAGMKLEDGWIRNEDGKAQRLYVMDSLSNYAIRATMQRQGKEYQTKSLMIRATQFPSVSGYVLCLSIEGFWFAGRKLDGAPIEILWQAHDSTVRVPRIGEEYTLEWGCVGDKLIGRIGKDYVKLIKDTKWSRGPAYFTGGEPIRDIEVINLDGLSEAEALRLLGVDEKGNDLRVLAAKQEQQMAEQAKAAEAMAAIPELKALHEQFVKLQGERVTAPFAAEVAKLNAGYVGGIDREIANEKKAGHLDGVIALEAEKKLIQGMGASGPQGSGGPEAPAPCPIPAEDDAATTEALKKLRGIYREAYAKIEAVRAENLKALTDPLDARLKQIEATLTQQDRIADAKTVREYREGLGRAAGPPAAASGPAAANTPNTALGGPSALPASKYPKGDDRKAAEWVLGLGGTVTIREGGKETTVTKLESLPKGRFELLQVFLSYPSDQMQAAPPNGLEPLAGLSSLEELEISRVQLQNSHFAILPSLSRLKFFKVDFAPITDEILPLLAGLKQLEKLGLTNCKGIRGTQLGLLAKHANLSFLDLGGASFSDSEASQLSNWKQLRELQLKGTDLGDTGLSALIVGNDIERLVLNRSKVTVEGVRQLKAMRGLQHLGWNFTVGNAASEVAVVAQSCPNLTGVDLDTREYTADDLAALGSIKGLTNLVIGNQCSETAVEGLLKVDLTTLQFRSVTGLTDATLGKLARHKSLRTLIITYSPNLTDAVLTSLVPLKTLATLSFTSCPKITTAGVEAFKKARPDVTVKR